MSLEELQYQGWRMRSHRDVRDLKFDGVGNFYWRALRMDVAQGACP